MKKSIITGITGQDGEYLAQLLLKKGYIIFTLIRSFFNLLNYEIRFYPIPLCQDTCPLSNLSIQTKAGVGK